MRYVAIWIAFAAMAGLCACAAKDGGAVQETAIAGMPGQIEAVHAAAVAQDQAVFWVSSNGCTQKSDLTPVVRRDGEGAILTLRRTKQDRCRSPQPEGVEMRWTFEELGLAPGSHVSIENPYQLTANAS